MANSRMVKTHLLAVRVDPFCMDWQIAKPENPTEVLAQGIYRERTDAHGTWYDVDITEDNGSLISQTLIEFLVDAAIGEHF